MSDSNILHKIPLMNTKGGRIAGLASGVIALIAYFAVGQIYSSAEAKHVVEAMNPSARILSSAIMSSSATILALMLTILSLTSNTEREFDRDFYYSIKHISIQAAVAIATSMLLLMIISVPITENNEIPSTVFYILYAMELGIMATLTGIMISIIYQLYEATTHLIEIFMPDMEDDEEEEEKHAKQSNQSKKKSVQATA